MKVKVFLQTYNVVSVGEVQFDIEPSKRYELTPIEYLGGHLNYIHDGATHYLSEDNLFYEEGKPFLVIGSGISLEDRGITVHYKYGHEANSAMIKDPLGLLPGKENYID